MSKEIVKTPSSFLEIARQTGVTVSLEREGKIKIWQGPFAGKRKTKGPLAEKTIGILAASEFSDFQAYYLAQYISEFGGKVVFVLVDWVKWKFSRPNVKTKGVIGQWGMSLDPIPMSAADLVKGKKIAGWLASKDAVTIMGGIYNWNWSAVIDDRIVTARVPNDLPEFIDAMTEALLSE